MRVFVAGATGAIGKPLLRHLITAGHEVTGLTRHDAKRSMLERAGAGAAVADVFDRDAIRRVLGEARPEGVIDLLTALPQRGPMRGSDFDAANGVRQQGTANVLDAPIAVGVRRYVAESVAFTYGWEEGLPCTEQDSLLDFAESRPPDEPLTWGCAWWVLTDRCPNRGCSLCWRRCERILEAGGRPAGRGRR